MLPRAVAGADRSSAGPRRWPIGFCSAVRARPGRTEHPVVRVLSGPRRPSALAFTYWTAMPAGAVTPAAMSAVGIG